MWTWRRTRALALALALTGLAVTACQKDETNPFYPPGTLLEGLACEDVIADYTTWVFFRSPVDPINCEEGPVPGIAFLSGGGANEQGEVYCTIPDDVSLVYLDPQVFWVSCPEAFGEGECAIVSDEQMAERVTEDIEANWAEGVTLDGVAPEGELGRYNCLGNAADLTYDPDFPSRIFFAQDSFGPGVPQEDTDCSAPWEEGNLCDWPAGPRRSVMGGGYFVLRPMSVGEHVLRSVKCLPETCTDYTFYITVVPRAEY